MSGVRHSAALLSAGWFTLSGVPRLFGCIRGFQMKVVAVRHKFGSVVGLATAVAVALALVVNPPDQLRPGVLMPEIHVVQLQAVTASAVLNDAVAQVFAELEPATSQAGPRSNASASATGSPNLFAAAVAIGLGAVLLPIWYLTFPVTLPLTILTIAALGGVCSGCYSGSSNGASNPLANIVLPGIQYWLTAPIQGIFNLLSPGSSAAAAAAASVPAPAPVAAARLRRQVAGANGVGQPRSAGSVPTGTLARSAAAQRVTGSASRDSVTSLGNVTSKRASHSKR